MKNRFKKIFAGLLSTAMLIGTVFTTSKPLEVNADDIIKSINLDAALLAPSSGTWDPDNDHKVYFGKYNDNETAFRVLKADNENMMLDCDTELRCGYFDNGYMNEWNGSELDNWLNGEEYYADDNVFTQLERSAIVKTEIAAKDTHYVFQWLYKDSYVNSYIFLLSASEAKDLYESEEARVKEGYYGWYRLRSKDASGSNISCISEGSIGYINSGLGFLLGISPVFNLDMSYVMFASEITMDKTSELEAVADNTSKEWKLTLSDNSKSVEVTSGEMVTGEGNIVTVPYTYSGDNVTQISVMITDEAYDDSDAQTQILYYGALQETDLSNTTGTGTFTLPDDLMDKLCGTDYHIYIIAEDVNGEKETDYAGEPVEIVPVYPVKINNGTEGGNYAAGNTITIIADAPAEGMQFKEWKVISGGVILADASSSITTFKMLQATVEITAVYEKITVPDNPEDVPKVGDNTYLYCVILLMAVSGMGVILTLKKQKANN